MDLIIPARNEEPNIRQLLAALPRRDLRYVIVVDNGSRDRTASLAREGGAFVVSEKRPGYGAACLAGLNWIARKQPVPDVVAFLDADLSDDPSLLAKLWMPIATGQADLVIGSRRRLAEPGALSITQRFGNRLACRMIRILTGKQYTDLGPMRVVRYSSLCQMKMADRTWGWTVEMQYKAAARQMPALEFDVPYRCRHAGASKISGTWTGSARAGYKIIVTIWRLWLSEKRRRL